MTEGSATMKPIVFTAHARKRMAERGTREEDVQEVLYRLNLEFNRDWDGRYYRMQQVAPVVAEEPDRLVVITVYTFYFQEGGKP
jgi:hypothetical protein